MPEAEKGATSQWPPSIFQDPTWLMSLGERAALEGLLGQLKPRLAIEIGTGNGGSLQRIAAHSVDVHSVDIAEWEFVLPANAQFHLGESDRILPQLLDRFTREGRNVDFVLVDGEHSAQAVGSDLLHLLSSPAIRRTVIVIHDTLNETVRKGVERVPLSDFPKVRYVLLDFVTGFMIQTGPFARQLWGGLGLVVVDVEDDFRVPEQHLLDAPSMIRLGARRLRWRNLLTRARGMRERARGALHRRPSR
jgi:hypothetical protein